MVFIVFLLISSYIPRNSNMTNPLLCASQPLSPRQQLATLVLLSIVGAILPQVVYRVDPLALLAATLRTYQRAGCESEQLSLSCPRGTTISIEIAQYGRTEDLGNFSACPQYTRNSVEPQDTAHGASELSISTTEMCVMGQLQYTLLQSVVDICQKKRHCQFTANSPALEHGGPCAGVQRFIEVAYKCRPYEFRSKVACENDSVRLVCNPYSRVVIYSAAFGYLDRDVVQCSSGNRSLNPMPSHEAINDTMSANKSSCQQLYATETVMHICHGRRRCEITAKTDIFGKPCQQITPQQLKIVYTCIPRKVLKKRYETQNEPDEVQQTQLQPDHDELYDEDQFYREGDGISTSLKIQSSMNGEGGYNFDANSIHAKRPESTKFPPNSPHNMHSTFEDQEDDFYLYFVTIVVVSVLLCVIIVIGRMTLYRMRSCSHDNDPALPPGKDKGSAVEMCKTRTKFDTSSIHDEVINAKEESILSNTLAAMQLSPLMTKEPYITYTSLSDNLYDTTDEQFLSTNVTVEHLKNSPAPTSNYIAPRSYPINHIRQDSFNCPLYVGVKSMPSDGTTLRPATSLYSESNPEIAGVSVSNILVPQGLPLAMPMGGGFGGSIAIPIHQNSLSQTSGQKGIAATTVSVVTTLPRPMTGSRMPYLGDPGLPIYYNSPNSYRGVVPPHPFG